MDDSDWFTVIAGFFVLGALLVGAVAVLEEAPPGRAAVSDGPSGSVDHLYLTIAFDPALGYDQYFPANFSVPADALVLVTITNYDNGSNPVPAAARAVTGTVGGTETVTTGTPAATETVAGLPPGDLAHTFTIPQLGLNVPIPSAMSVAAPSITSFAAFFNGTGTLSWICQAPCDPVSMMTPGFMSGTVTLE